MRNLNLNELNEVQGRGIGFLWAFRAGELFADLFAMYEVSHSIPQTTALSTPVATTPWATTPACAPDKR